VLGKSEFIVGNSESNLLLQQHTVIAVEMKLLRSSKHKSWAVSFVQYLSNQRD